MIEYCKCKNIFLFKKKLVNLYTKIIALLKFFAFRIKILIKLQNRTVNAYQKNRQKMEKQKN